MNNQELLTEFDHQVDTLRQKGYAKIAGLSEQEFFRHLEPLREKAGELDAPEVNLEKGILPFVIVVKSDLVASEQAMALTQKNGKNGVTILRPHTSQDFNTTNDVAIPDSMAYLLTDIDRGKENINLPPNEAIKLISDMGRFPLTIDEGIAIITHFPEFLIKNNCFSLLASRTDTDQRVPAIWINSKKEPNLGWCWDGNPHTWLGSASGVKRIGS
ncbi:MAG TPA: DUF5701 family protein [Candidatus Levybacteria bacterium]|nr:DUF5701 family protein [Candidatus Levybacteria bacterium]